MHVDHNPVRIELETHLDVATTVPSIRLFDAEVDEATKRALQPRDAFGGNTSLMRKARSDGLGNDRRRRRGGNGERRTTKHARHGTEQADMMGPGPKCPPVTQIVKPPLARPVSDSA